MPFHNQALELERESMFNYFWNASQNKNARIVSRVSRNGKLRTETARRDQGSTEMAVTTDPRSNASKLFLDLDDGSSVSLSGREARTLYRLLSAHFEYSGKPV